MFHPKSPIFIVRNSSSLTAKPSTDPQRNRGGADVEQYQQPIALRELIKKAGVHIDAYIIPSQDAHQILPFSTTKYFLELLVRLTHSLHFQYIECIKKSSEDELNLKF